MGNPIGGGGGGSGDDDGDELSEDVLIQILVWLPVKSLLRFKSVSKSWRALIESPFFIDLHTTTATFNSSSSKFGSFILLSFGHTAPSFQHGRKMSMLSSGSPGSPGSGCGGGGGGGEDIIDDDDQVVFKVDDLGFPPCTEEYQLTQPIRMVGSCNGLICLHDLQNNDITLCNPATKQFRILPKPITIQKEGIEIDMFRRDFVALGFDVKTKDYKVVRISSFLKNDRAPGDGGCFFRAQVYSLSTDSWRPLEGINYIPVTLENPTFLNPGIYMNGCYFFVGKDGTLIWENFLALDGSKIPVRNNSLMLSFDFTKETFTTMQFPDHDGRHDFVLSYLGDKVALFMIQRRSSLYGFKWPSDCDDYEYYDIWVLNEQLGSGVVVNKESWTKLHSFRIINRGTPMTQPRCISNNGEFALISTQAPGEISKLLLFNLVTKEEKKVFLFGRGVLRADVYKQTLVSIIGGNGAAAITD